MADVEQIKIALRNAHNAGDTEAARRLASMLVAAQAPPAPAAAPMGYETIPGAAAEMLAGVPLIGEWTDEMANRISPGLGQRFQAEREALRTSYPALSIAANLAGALGSYATGAGALGAVARGAPAVARGVEATRRFLSAGQGVGRPAQALRAGGVGAGAGAVEGAVSGAGAAEEGERFGGAMRGALLGGAFGGAAGLGATGMQALASRLRGGDAQRILSEQAGFEVSPQAAATVQDLVMRGDVDAAERMMQQLGNEATLAGASQRAAQGLGDVSRVSPEAAQIGREAIEGVTQREVTALTGKFDSTLGPAVPYQQLKDETRAATAKEREAFYEGTAYKTPINYASENGLKLEALLGNLRSVPNSSRIVNAANELMALEGRQSKQIKVTADADGNITKVERLPDVEQWDYITRALNDLSIGAGRRTDIGGRYRKLSREIRNTVKEEVPAYGTAVSAGQQNILRDQAVDYGYKLLDPAVTREEIRNLRDAIEDTKTDLPENLRVSAVQTEQGLRSRLDEIVANARSSISRPDTAVNALTTLDTLLSSDATRVKLVDAIGKDKADQIFDELANVRATLDLRRAANVSERASATATVRKGLQIQAPLLDSLANQGVTGAGTTIFRALTGRTEEAREIQQQQLAVEIARVLTQMKGQNARAALALMRRYETTGKPLNEKQARMVAKVVTLPSALAFYSQREPIAESATEAMLSLGQPDQQETE